MAAEIVERTPELVRVRVVLLATSLEPRQVGESAVRAAGGWIGKAVYTGYTRSEGNFPSFEEATCQENIQAIPASE